MSLTNEEKSRLLTIIQAYNNGKKISDLQEVNSIDRTELIEVVKNNVSYHAKISDIESPQIEQNREDIARLRSDLTTETEERKQADKALSNWISDERDNRIEENNRLDIRINTESAERKTADIALHRRIDTLSLNHGLVFDVTDMIEHNSEADISAWMFMRKEADDDHKPVIMIKGTDTSNESNDLVLSPVFGFGAFYDTYKAETTTDGITFINHAIKVTSEERNRRSTITVPAGCSEFNIHYYARVPIRTSFWIDGNHVFHPFELENTPLGNLSTTLNTVTINGISVLRANVKQISFGDSYDEITLIMQGLLRNFASLTSVDLRGLRNATAIGSFFLENCSGLTSIDLSPLSNVRNFTDGGALSSRFLAGCSGLTSIDLSPLNNITRTGHEFLRDCTGLTSIDLSPLSGITFTGNSFLHGCSGLTSIDLSPLNSITLTGSSFLHGCSGLTSIDLSPLSGITFTGNSFLHGCSGLTSIDLSPLSSITLTGNSFLHGCSGLMELNTQMIALRKENELLKGKIEKMSKKLEYLKKDV